MEIVLLWCFVLAWMAKRGAEDLVHAVKGTPNPRYEVKKAKARAAGQPVKGQPRYATKEWAADLLSDALVAHTEKRRTKAKAKAQPVDDMIGLTREPKPKPQPTPQASRLDDDEDWCERHQMPRVRQGVLERGPRSRFCPCGPRITFEPPEPPEDFDPAPPPTPDQTPDQTLARIIQFPNIKKIEKEISMSNPEATNLATAIAFAGAAASAHQSFATAGAEGYVGALQRGDMDGEPVDTAREAMEASGIAADKWNAHKATLEAQLNIKEAYQAQPGAANKGYLLNG